MRRPCEDHVYNHTRCVLPEVGEDLMEQIKCAGRAGIISYILWEWQPVQKHPCHLVTPVRQLRGSSRSSTPNGSAGAYEPQLSRPGGRPVAPRAAFPAFNQEEWAFWIGAGGVACFAYFQASGGWPDLSNPEDQAKVAHYRHCMYSSHMRIHCVCAAYALHMHCICTAYALRAHTPAHGLRAHCLGEGGCLRVRVRQRCALGGATAHRHGQQV